MEHTSTTNETLIKSALESLKIRFLSLNNPTGFGDFQKGHYADVGFIPLLKNTLAIINESPSLSRSLKTEIRSFLARLSSHHILPYAAVWPRRYFYELTYYCHWEPPEERFIYRAMDALYRSKGYEGGWDDPLVSTAKKEFETALKEFYSIRLSREWDVADREYEEEISTLTPENKAALEIGKMLVRFFYVEGLAAELLEAWKSYEQFIYLTPHYRDHFLHLLYDFLLGCKLIDSLMPQIKENWIHYSSKQISNQELRIRLMRTWVIASFFHDVGYPAQTLENLQDTLQNTFFEKIPGLTLTPLNLKKAEYIKDELSEFLTMLSFIFTADEFSFNFEELHDFKERRYYPEGLIFGAMNSLLADQVNKLDHGVMGALFLLLTLKVDVHELTIDANRDIEFKVRQDKYRRERSEILEDVVSASLAIALHNMRQQDYSGLTVDFRSHPISFMLMLCDQLHEWDRRSNFGRQDEPFQNVFGLNVFLRPDNPIDIFASQHSVADLEGTRFQTESFYSFVKNRITQWDGVTVNVHEKVGQFLPQLINLIKSRKILNRYYLRIDLKSWIEKNIDDSCAKALLNIILMNLTEDVITLGYVGGNPRTRGMELDRIGGVWKGLRHLFFKNLSFGPAVCILHGYDEDHVEPFFIAEYDVPLKAYRIENSYEPKARR